MASSTPDPVLSKPLLPRRILYYGIDSPAARQIPLRAGPLTLLFEPDLAQIRHICIGRIEVLRAVYGAVRDQNWNTVLPEVRDLSITNTDGGFRVRFTAECRSQAVHFVWQAELDGEPSGLIRYRFRGKALNTFLRNRIGFCVLHDGEKLPGQPIRVEHVDGKATEGFFPLLISPHQPFFNLRAITHTVQPGLMAEVRMEGDTFEMEDQRNWTDASYKTYSTPLALPFPVEVTQGTEIEQTVTLRLTGEAPNVTAHPSAWVQVNLDTTKAFPLPSVGACMAADAPPLDSEEAARLRRASFAHLRVDLHLAESGWQDRWRRALSESKALTVPLELAIHLSNNAGQELAVVAEAISTAGANIKRVLVFHREVKSTTQRWMEMARAALRPVLPGVPLGSGSNAYFTEVNRGRPPLEVSDFVAWSANPQVHAFDNLSLAETLSMHRTTLESARAFSGSLPLVVSPVSLKPRFNPNATATVASAEPDLLPDTVDPRQLSLFGAGWTLGVLKYLTAGGASSVTLYETTGWRGWMESAAGSPLPAQFPSQPGWAFPLYHVLADWGEFAGGEMLMCASMSPLAVEAVVLRREGRLRVLLANLSGVVQAVRLSAADIGPRVDIKRLDEDTTIAAIREPEAWRVVPGAVYEPQDGSYLFTLLPYAVLRVDREIS